jgi:branched-chain amino acid transport system ATP-binding protein
MSTPVLEINGLHSAYGKIEVLHGIDIRVEAGQIVSLIGANGAGKTTLLRTISGMPQARAGEIRFFGEDITRMKPHAIVHLGIAHAPEGRRIFHRMSVLENLRLGATPTREDTFAADLEEAFAIFPRMHERRHQRAGTLSGGEQQMLAIARALMGRPRLLLLDEPSLGLAPLMVKAIFEKIADINRAGVTVLLVEQNAYHGLRLAHQAYVMATGRIVRQGSGAELLDDSDVRKAYLEGV